MKKTSLYIIILLFAGLSSCKKYLDVNKDPYLPLGAPSNTFLPQILYSMAEGEMFDSRYIGQYTQNWVWTTANNNYDRHGSRITAGSASALTQTYRNHYWAIGSNVNQMVRYAQDHSLAGYEGIGNTIKSWSWQIVTDGYGELAFTQAWDNTRTKFDYDSQKVIYAGIVELANKAIQQLESNEGKVDPKLADWDLMYHGDLTKWKKFDYAVLARNELHKSNKASFDPDKVIDYVNKSFASNDDNASIHFDGTSGNTASFYGISRGNYGSYRPGKIIIGMLDGTVFNGVVDPRLPLMFNQSTDGSYRGVEAAIGDTAAVKAVRMYGKYLFKDDAAFPLISYAELQFIKAEAAFIKGDKETAYNAFKLGIKAHMDFTGVASADQDTYMSSAAVPQTKEALTLKDILDQKYIALFMNNETWSDLRRHDYDTNLYPGYKIPEVLMPENNNSPVERLVYIQFSEFDWNIETVKKQGADQPDYHTRKLWVFTNRE
jgi:hypothetical protein